MSKFVINPYSVASTITTYEIPSGGWDGFDNAGTWDGVTTNFAIGDGGKAGDYHGGVGFAVTLAQGTVVTLAELKLDVFTINNSGADVNIYGDDRDDPPIWSDGAEDPEPINFTETTETVNYVFGSIAIHTVNVTAIVNEILARPGYASNHMRFALQGGAGGTNNNNVRSFEASSGQSPQLVVTL